MQMKKIGYTLLVAAYISASFGTCFAEKAPVVAHETPVVIDREYPDYNLRFHSWVTGVGASAVAHTQHIDMATGRVLKEVDMQCGYTDSVYSDKIGRHGSKKNILEEIT